MNGDDRQLRQLKPLIIARFGETHEVTQPWLQGPEVAAAFYKGVNKHGDRWLGQYWRDAVEHSGSLLVFEKESGRQGKPVDRVPRPNEMGAFAY